jgi:predicted O-methyltransferase YrrM
MAIDTQAAKLRAFRALRRSAERVGFQVVPKTFYSPIPVLDELPPDAWERRDPMRGISFDLDAQLAWIERELGPAMSAFAPPERATRRADEYTLANDSYGRVGADILHGVVRALKPRRIVELGSGQSTLIMAAAAALNAAEGSPTELRTYDPYPSVARAGMPGLAELAPVRAQDVPLEAFTALEAGDVLFVDTTHTVKIGSDVNRIVLDVLPALAPGVIVHVHDIFLPYEYPRRFAEELGLHWAEQYLLQAFLACNRDFEVLAAVHALCQDRPEAMSRLAPTWQPGVSASAFWMRRA